MKKPELARRLADAGDTTPAAAADRLDEIVFAILKKLKEGKSATFPGVIQIPSKQSQPKPGRAR